MDNDNIEVLKSMLENESLEYGIENGFIFKECEYTLIRKNFENLFTILLPSNFESMDTNLARQKYLQEARPKYILTNEETTINFCMDILENNNIDLWDKIEQYSHIVQSFNPSVNMILNDVFNLNDLDVGLFSYITPSLDEDIYIVVFFFSIEDKEIYANFNLPVQYREFWEPYIFNMIQSAEKGE